MSLNLGSQEPTWEYMIAAAQKHADCLEIGSSFQADVHANPFFSQAKGNPKLA